MSVIITPQGSADVPPYQLTANRAPNFDDLEARAEMSTTIAKAAFYPYLPEMVREFYGSPLCSLFGMGERGDLPPGQNGLSGIDIGFTSVTKWASNNFNFSIWQTKKLFSNKVLNATTTAAGAAGGSITAAFNIDLGGAPIAQGDLIEMVDSTDAVIVYICMSIGTTASNVQSGVVLRPIDGTIQSNTVLTSSYVFDRGRQSDTVTVGEGQYSESRQFVHNYKLPSYNNIKRNVFNDTNILQKQWFQFANSQNDPFLPGLSSSQPNPNQQMWWSQAYRAMTLNELKTIHRGWMFSVTPDSPNAAVYGVTAAGGFTTPFNGLITQVEVGGYDIQYTSGALIASDFDEIYERYKDDSIGGQEFAVSGGNAFLNETDLALSQGITSQTLLNVAQRTEVATPRDDYGMTRVQGWTRYINGRTGANFSLTELTPFSGNTTKMVYGSSAIIVPKGLQKIVVDGQNVTSPAIIMAYNGDTSSFLENRSGAPYSGKFGMMPFVNTYVNCHASLKPKIFLGAATAENVNATIVDTITGDLTVTMQHCLPILGCVEATGYIHT